MSRSLPSTSLIQALIVGAAVQLAACKPAGVIEDLGTLGGASYGIGINGVGNVVGASYLSSVNPHASGMHAFRYVDGLGMNDVGTLPPGNISAGQSINSGFFIVGGSFVAGFVPHAFRANATLNLTDLGTLGGEFSNAWDINDHGVITGEASNAAEDVHAFVLASAGMQDIGTLGGMTSIGRSINESGQVAGESRIGTGQATRAFRFTNGVGMINLGTLSGGTTSSGYGINNNGQVVGESDTSPILSPNDTGVILKRTFQFKGFSFFGTHAFLWTEGVGMRDLGELGGGTSRANAISTNGTVVGTSRVIGGASHAFRWTQVGGMIDLNTLLPSNSGWVLIEANDINDRGQITGFGLHNGLERAYRLNPPELVNTSAQPTNAK